MGFINLNMQQPNPSKRYVLKQVETKHEMDAVMDVIWAANYDPYEPIAQLVFPVLGFTAKDRALAVLESKVRFWNSHQNDLSRSSQWCYVFDSHTGKVVGCGQWEVFEQNPYKDGVPKIKAPWWPEGECREFCESILNQVYKPRTSWMRRPHVALSWLAVYPSHRRQGIASLILHHGISLADSKSLECFLEASSMGKSLYEKFNFRSLFKIAFDTSRPRNGDREKEKENLTGGGSISSIESDDLWRKCEFEMTPEPVYAMWRPRLGIWKNDGVEVVGPWEAEHKERG